MTPIQTPQYNACNQVWNIPRDKIYDVITLPIKEQLLSKCSTAIVCIEFSRMQNSVCLRIRGQLQESLDAIYDPFL